MGTVVEQETSDTAIASKALGGREKSSDAELALGEGMESMLEKSAPLQHRQLFLPRKAPERGVPVSAKPVSEVACVVMRRLTNEVCAAALLRCRFHHLSLFELFKKKNKKKTLHTRGYQRSQPQS